MLTYKGQFSYDDDADAMTFNLHNGHDVVRCAISARALQDHFGSDEDPETVFSENVLDIVDAAVSKYSAGKVDADGWVRLKSADKI